jgi:CBS domain-containing protein
LPAAVPDSERAFLTRAYRPDKTTHAQKGRAMPQWRVRDVMNTEVITAPDDTSYAEIAAILADKRISAVSIVDRFDVVVGVVSWTDLHGKIKIGDPDATVRFRWWRRRAAPLVRWPAGSAVDVMSAPPVTIGPDASLAAAARVMYHRDVGRLLVVDDHGRLRGVVSRSDLLKIHWRMDEVIRDEVMQQVLRRTLMIEPGTVQATVEEGVVTLTGHTARRTTVLVAVRLTAAVAGVTDVVDRLTFDLDDTVPPIAPSEPAGRDPFRGLWIAHRPARTAGDRLSNELAQQATTLAAQR